MTIRRSRKINRRTSRRTRRRVSRRVSRRTSRRNNRRTNRKRRTNRRTNRKRRTNRRTRSKINRPLKGAGSELDQRFARYTIADIELLTKQKLKSGSLDDIEVRHPNRIYQRTHRIDDSKIHVAEPDNRNCEHCKGMIRTLVFGVSSGNHFDHNELKFLAHVIHLNDIPGIFTANEIHVLYQLLAQATDYFKRDDVKDSKKLKLEDKIISTFTTLSGIDAVTHNRAKYALQRVNDRRFSRSVARHDKEGIQKMKSKADVNHQHDEPTII